MSDDKRVSGESLGLHDLRVGRISLLRSNFDLRHNLPACLCDPDQLQGTSGTSTQLIRGLETDPNCGLDDIEFYGIFHWR